MGVAGSCHILSGNVYCMRKSKFRTAENLVWRCFSIDGAFLEVTDIASRTTFKIIDNYKLAKLELNDNNDKRTRKFADGQSQGGARFPHPRHTIL